MVLYDYKKFKMSTINKYTRHLYLFTILATIVSAGIVSIDDMKLLPFEFTYNYRFVFSDRLPEPLNNQA